LQQESFQQERESWNSLSLKGHRMKTYGNLYEKIYSKKNLVLAWKKARKGKTQKNYVKNFEKELPQNLRLLHEELKTKTYKPKQLEIFVLRDPKTRVISKADFRDRIVHHALCNVIEPILDKTFINDSCANRRGKGSLFALKRFEIFQGKVTNNFTSRGYCLKADIKHYFKEIDRNILFKIIEKKVVCGKTLWLIKIILKIETHITDNRKGIPLGNLTSQFFANFYLNELDSFVKHKLRVKNYIRYVDDFVILHRSREQLENWKNKIEIFLGEKLF
jgi:RNA-directed DNA polymerase